MADLSFPSPLARCGTVLAIVAGAAVGVAAPAAADESNTQTACTQYTDGQIWQTSTQWGRVRQRLCIEYTNTDVRAHVQLQTDWPSDCELSVGIPPTAGIGCPVGRLTKLGKLTYKKVEMPISWQHNGDPVQSTTCEFTDVTAFDMSDTTLTCDGAWMPIAKGDHNQVWADGLAADVKDDGDGLKLLPSETHGFTFT